MMRFPLPALAPIILLGACATTPPTSAQIDACRNMERDMGVATTHDHNELRTTITR